MSDLERTVSVEKWPEVTRDANEPAAKTASRRDIIFTMILFFVGGIITGLDNIIVATALPSISKDLRGTSIQYSWVGSSFLVALAGFLPLWAPLSNSFGRKAVFASGHVVFFVGSLVAALAKNMNMLIAGRTVQGCGAGGIIVMTNYCISTMFALKDRGLHLGLFGLATSLGSAIAPVIGGALSETIGWRWCFWINLPLSAGCIALIFPFIYSPKTSLPIQKSITSIDWLGAFFVLSGTICLLVGLQAGGELYPWKSAAVIALIVVGGVLLGVFIIQQSRSTSKILPVRFFTNRNTCALLILAASHGFTFIACLFYLPIYLQYGLGQSPVRAGVWALAVAIPSGFATIAAAVIIKKTGRFRPVIWFSAGSIVLGLGLFITFGSHVSTAKLVVFQIIVGVGIGPLFQAPLVALQAWSQSTDVALSSSVFVFLRVISSAISVVLGQVILQAKLRGTVQDLAQAGIPSEIIDGIVNNFTQIHSISAKLTAPQLLAVAQAFAASMRYVWIFYTAIGAVGFLASLTLQKKSLT